MLARRPTSPDHVGLSLFPSVNPTQHLMPSRQLPVLPKTKRALALGLLALMATAAAQAQSVPAPAPAAPAPARATVPVVSTSASDASASEEDIVELTPFVVAADADRGYQSTSTLAGTRLRTELRDVGAAISVVNAQFMADTGSTNAKDILVYTTGTEAAGMGGNISGVSTGNGFSNPEDGLLSPNQQTRVRGLSGADLTRDFFATDIGMDSYNTERVDISRGANAILFGLGSPAGIINNQLKMANLRKNGVTFSQNVSRYGSHREILDVNQVVLKNQLAVRVIGLNDEEEFRQKPAFENDRRLYAAMRWEPKLFRNGLTQLQVSYEDGPPTVCQSGTTC
jgi:outer membrane receptor for ferric coprogen and ferric-rhodotorulic acid